MKHDSRKRLKWKPRKYKKNTSFPVTAYLWRKPGSANIWQPHFWKFVKVWGCFPLDIRGFTDDYFYMPHSPSKGSLPHSLF